MQDVVPLDIVGSESTATFVYCFTAKLKKAVKTGYKQFKR